MNDIETPDQRIERARKTLSGWGWMAVVSTRPVEVIGYLRLEVTALGALTFENPKRAPVILALISKFHALIEKIEARQERRQSAARPSQKRALLKPHQSGH